ncbi:MAG: anti-sigma factor antagonist [Flavobacteriaceae bacterium]|nr:anti-sigma factor antagonist [Flavobacteriaceae bacterium]
MALQITEKKGNFYIQGEITCDNVQALKLHFEYVLRKRKYVTINISDVTEIDSEGVVALTQMYHYALLTKKIFTIIGVGSKEMYEHFKNQNIA